MARVAELEAKLNLPPETPSNSSLPPSKGQKADQPEKAKKLRKGRPGVARKLARTRLIRDEFAAVCLECGKAASLSDQLEVFAYDHIDLPEIKPVVTRVNIHSGACRHCGKRIAAPRPRVCCRAARSALVSPRWRSICTPATWSATTGWWRFQRAVRARNQRRRIANIFSRTHAPFAAEAGRIDAEVRGAAVIVSDETPARVEGQACWQWVFGSATAVAHRIAASRGKAVVSEFLKDATPEVWVSDRLGARMNHATAHQVCLAHLLRDSRYAIEARDKLFAPGFNYLLKRAIAIGRRRESLADSTLLIFRRDLERRLGRLLAVEPDTEQASSSGAAWRNARTNFSSSSPAAMCRQRTTYRSAGCAPRSSSAK